MNTLRPLPFWKDETATVNYNMGANAPFIVTKSMPRADLGECVVSTEWPHIVAKIHAFHTSTAKTRDMSDAGRERLASAEQQRKEWLEQRAAAFALRRAAVEDGCSSVKEYQEKHGKTYDEELDEPRVIVKVPSFNIYLEFLGVMDDIESEELEWTGYDGVFAVLGRMSTWLPSMYQTQMQRRFYTHRADMQPLDEWVEEYDPMMRPFLYNPRGIGYDHVDPSRHQENEKRAVNKKIYQDRAEQYYRETGIRISPEALMRQTIAEQRKAKYLDE